MDPLRTRVHRRLVDLPASRGTRRLDTGDSGGMMQLELDDRTYIVSGGTKGLGLATAELLVS